MQAPCYSWIHACLVATRPTVGDLMSLCEDNFRLLTRLFPDLHQARGCYDSQFDAGLRLHLQVLEQAPYTTTIRFTYFFDDFVDATPGQPEPDARLRVYHDARQVEVLDLRQTALPLYGGYQSPALRAKWKANLFLSKWLSYCLSEGHRFRSSAVLDSDEGSDELPSTCL